MSLSDRQKKEMVEEALDPQRVRFYCPKHFYSGPVKENAQIKPGLGCPDCWKIFYFHEMAMTPPDKRREKLEEIEEVLHKMVEMVEAGTWDFVPYEHAKIEIGQE